MPKGRKPTRTEEGKLQRQGYRLVAGADEAGKGAWAGPLVAGAVVLPEDFDPEGIRDSKQLSPREREVAFVRITKDALGWAVHVVEVGEIDRGGIGPANRRALTEAIRKLPVKPHAAVIDAVLLDLPIPSKSVIKGDEKELAVAAASIVAKVVRDRLMDQLAAEFPAYAFESHKGYGTPKHAKHLSEHGPSEQHRRSFAPVQAVLKGQKHRDRPRRMRTSPKGAPRRR